MEGSGEREKNRVRTVDLPYDGGDTENKSVEIPVFMVAYDEREKIEPGTQVTFRGRWQCGKLSESRPV